MDYIVHFFWNHLISCQTEVRMIDGKEEVCLIVPTKTNQIKRGKRGNWLSTFRMIAEPPNENMTTHTLQLGYLNYDEVNKAKEMGIYGRTQRLGRVREHDRTPSKKVDRTNNASNVKFDGVIILSDIPKELIIRNNQSNKRYLPNLTLRGLQDDGRIFTGSLCVDDIPREDIKQDPNTGKKFINVRFVKTEYLDQYMNTHELVVARPNSEDVISIGLFKEWRKEGYVPPKEPLPPMPPNEPPKNIPDSIQGIRF